MNVWTVNTAEEMEAEIEKGSTAIITDEPDILADVLAEPARALGAYPSLGFGPKASRDLRVSSILGGLGRVAFYVVGATGQPRVGRAVNLRLGAFFGRLEKEGFDRRQRVANLLDQTCPLEPLVGHVGQDRPRVQAVCLHMGALRVSALKLGGHVHQGQLGIPIGRPGVVGAASPRTSRRSTPGRIDVSRR